MNEEPSSLATPRDCRGCGACCFSTAVEYVRVTGEDWTRLGDAAEGWAHFVGHRAFMRMTDGHCAALRMARSEDGALDFTCAIYDRRPQVCRDLARGSAECAGEIATKAGRRRCLPGAGSLSSPARTSDRE